MAIFVKSKQLIEPHSNLSAWTFGGKLNTLIEDVKDKIPKGYTVVSNKSNKIKDILNYSKKLETKLHGKYNIDIYNDIKRFFIKNAMTLFMVVREVIVSDVPTKTTTTFITDPEGNMATSNSYETIDPIVTIDTVYIFLEKDNKISVFCVYDKDEKDVGKIVDTL